MTEFRTFSTGKKRLIYGCAFLLLLGIEVLIGFFGRGFIRGSVGDILAVIAVYSAARILLTEKPRLLFIWVSAFAAAVELVQLTDFSSLFGENTLFSIIVGATFDPLDLICYCIGGAVCAVWDILLVKS